MKYSPLPYSGRQAFRLIKRDIKNFFKRGGANNKQNNPPKKEFKERLDSVMESSSYSSDDFSTVVQQDSDGREAGRASESGDVIENRPPTADIEMAFDRVIVEPPQGHYIKTASDEAASHTDSLMNNAFALKEAQDTTSINKGPTCRSVEIVVPSASSGTTYHARSNSDPSTASTATEYNEEDAGKKEILPLQFSYTTASTKLDSWYKNRDRTYTPSRWAIRGVVILLTIAFSYSDQNPIYKRIFGRSFISNSDAKNRLAALLAPLYEADPCKAIHVAESLLTELHPFADPAALLHRLGNATVLATDLKDDMSSKLGRLLLPEFAELKSSELGS